MRRWLKRGGSGASGTGSDIASSVSRQSDSLTSGLTRKNNLFDAASQSDSLTSGLTRKNNLLDGPNQSDSAFRQAGEAGEAGEAGADVAEAGARQGGAGDDVAEGVTKNGIKWKKTKGGVVALVAGGAIAAAIIADTNTQKKAKGVCEYCCEQSTTEGSKWEGNESPKECYNYVRENPDEFSDVITSEESKSIPEYPHDDDFPTKDPNLQKCVSCYTQCDPLYYFWDEIQGVTIDSFGPDTTNTVSEATEAELDAVLKIQANTKILENAGPIESWVINEYGSGTFTGNKGTIYIVNNIETMDNAKNLCVNACEYYESTSEKTTFYNNNITVSDEYKAVPEWTGKNFPEKGDMNSCTLSCNEECHYVFPNIEDNFINEIGDDIMEAVQDGRNAIACMFNDDTPPYWVKFIGIRQLNCTICSDNDSCHLGLAIFEALIVLYILYVLITKLTGGKSK